MWGHLHRKSKKKVRLREIESTKVVARGWRAGKYGELSGRAQTYHKLSAVKYKV